MNDNESERENQNPEIRSSIEAIILLGIAVVILVCLWYNWR